MGAGPAGLLLGQLLHKEGIDALILERRSAEYVAGRIRAGVLEPGTVDVLERAGVASRLHAEGLIARWRGDRFSRAAASHRPQGADREGRHRLRPDRGDARSHGRARRVRRAERSTKPKTSRCTSSTERSPERDLSAPGSRARGACDFIAGCDGFHGVSRRSIPATALKIFERVYPFGWLGLLADVPPPWNELIYANSERGFALASMRSPTRVRCYIQCSLEDRVENWSDEQFWDEFRRRIGEEMAALVPTRRRIEKSIAPLRSFVAEPLRFGQLFLAGDAAHIVPPTGAKGLNLAVERRALSI